MKKRKFTSKKLTINKSVVSDLNKQNIIGGAPRTFGPCPPISLQFNCNLTNTIVLN